MKFISKGEVHFISLRRKVVCAITPPRYWWLKGGDVLEIQNNII